MKRNILKPARAGRQLKLYVFFLYLCLVPASGFLPAHATGVQRPPNCHQLSGMFTVTADTTCELLTSPSRHTVFADMIFLAEQGTPPAQSCSSADLEGYFGRFEIQGHAAIAQATNPYPEIDNENILAIGANAIDIHLKEIGFKLGELYVRHYAHINPVRTDFNEEVVVVSGDGMFRGAVGTIRLSGNLFQGAQMSGTVCIPDFRNW